MILSDLVNDGILASATLKGPVSLRFTSDAVEVLFPRLFVDHRFANHHNGAQILHK